MYTVYTQTHVVGVFLMVEQWGALQAKRAETLNLDFYHGGAYTCARVSIMFLWQQEFIWCKSDIFQQVPVKQWGL